jgi:hypothetical protein
MRCLWIFVFCLVMPALHAQHWSGEKATEWYTAQPFLVGCNFIPSTAINQLEMWQAETFDTATIDRELGWAQGIGMNTARVFLHDLAYQQDPAGFKHRMDIFLTISARHGIRPLFVFFDDCWNADPKVGPQPAPIPGVHNSGWMQSPGKQIVHDSKEKREWPRLEKYVKDILATYKDDKRILMWDLYNEPGNSHNGARSLPLLKAIFGWAREVNPSQPLTAGVWMIYARLNRFQLQNSDVITFHDYMSEKELQRRITKLKSHHRPVICTEWMARTFSLKLFKMHSRPETHLPVFKKNNVGCINWGLVAGKTQTIYPWGAKTSTLPPVEWFHDLFYPDGRPYRPEEIDAFRRLRINF